MVSNPTQHISLHVIEISGSFQYHKAIGAPSLDENATVKRMGLDSVFQIASCTKLITTIAVLKCVETGLIGLDDDVVKVLPELNKYGILAGFDDEGKPKLVDRKETITLR